MAVCHAVILIIALLLSVGDLAAQPSELTIPEFQEQFSDYGCREIRARGLGSTARTITRPAQVVHPWRPGLDSGLFVSAYNPSLNVHGPAIFSNYAYPSFGIDDDPVNLTLRSWRLYDDALLGDNVVAAGGYRGDTAWLCRLNLYTDQTDFAVLSTGHDSTGDDRWDPEIMVLELVDYDLDGVTEGFFYVNPGREGGRRVLICMELETLRREWDCDVSGLMSWKNFQVVVDSVEPHVVFATYNVKQGRRDRYFNDLYAQLGVVDRRGQVLVNSILCKSHGGQTLCRAWDETQFLVTHEVPIQPYADSLVMPEKRNFISLIGLSGEVLKTISVASVAHHVWLGEFEGERVYYVAEKPAGMRVYDCTLTEIAYSSTFTPGEFRGRVQLPDRPDTLLILSDGIYRGDFRKIVAFPWPASVVEPIAVDSSGNATALLLSASNRYAIIEVYQRSLWQRATAAYVRFRPFVVSLLIALTLGLAIALGYSYRTLRRLRRAEASYSDLLSNLPIGFFRSRTSGETIMLSPGMMKLYGFSSEAEMLKHDARQSLVNPGDAEDIMQRLSREGMIIEKELHVRRKDGSTFWVLANLFGHFNASGELEYFDGFNIDITERKEAERALEVEERRYRQLMESVQAGITVIDADGVFRYINEFAANKYGYKASEIIGHTVDFLFPAEIVEEQMRIIREVIRTDIGRGPFETRTLVGDGHRWYLVVVQPYRDHTGSLNATMVITHDITDIKEAREALAYEGQRYRELMESVQADVSVIDTDGVFLYINECAAGKFSRKATEVIGKPMDFLFPEENASRQLEYVRQVVADEKGTEPFEWRTMVAGKVRWYLVTLQPYRDNSRSVQAAMIIAYDITEFKATRDALEYEEQNYRTLMESVQAGVGLFDYEGTLLFMNKNGAAVFGATPEQLIGKTQHDLFPKEIADRQLADIRRVIDTEESGFATEPESEMQGQQRLFFTRLQPYRNQVGKVTGCLVIAHDITEVKRAEQAIKFQEEKYRLLMESVPAAVVLFNWEGELLYINEYGAAAMGATPSDLVGSTQYDMFPKEIADKQLASIRTVIETGEPIATESPTTIQGVSRWYYNRLRPYRDESGNITSCLLIADDVTEVKQAAERVRHLGEAIEHSINGIAEADADGEVVFVNRAWAEMHGCDIDDVVGKHFSVFHTPEQMQHEVDPFNELVFQKGFHTGEMGHRRMDGTTFETFMSVTALKNESGNINGLLAVALDITELLEAQKQIRDEERKRYQQAKDIAGGFSHEIRNALFPARTYLSKMRAEMVHDELRHDALDRLARIDAAISRAIRMTTLVSRYTKVESLADPQSVDLYRVWQVVLSDYRDRIQDLNVQVATIGLEAGSLVMSNPDHLRIVLSNLLTNALDAVASLGSNGKVWLTVLERAGAFEVCLDDNGSGIDPEQRSRVFDAFYTTKPDTGTGIGLATVKKIVEMYGGEVGAEGNDSGGARFRLVLKKWTDDVTPPTRE